MYRKIGDRATDMPSAVYFGSKATGMYALNEHVKYDATAINWCRITEKRVRTTGLEILRPTAEKQPCLRWGDI